MGLLKKHRVHGREEPVVPGIAVHAPLRPIKTDSKDRNCDGYDEDEDDERNSTVTPKGKDSRIPEPLVCPPAPRKPPRSLLKFHFNVSRKFFFTSPEDLESLFNAHIEKGSD